MKIRLFIIILIIGLISACGSQPAEAPASPPTDKPVSVTDSPVLPTDTAIPPSEVPSETPTDVPTEEPTAETVSNDAATISFTNDVNQILQSRCVICHGGSRGTEEGLNMTSYESLISGSNNGPVIIPGDAEASLLVELITKQEMPKRGPKLTPPQIQLITDWVNQGALDN